MKNPPCISARRVRHQRLPCHRPVGVEAHIEVHTGELCCLAEDGLSLGGFRQSVPIAHLVGSEFLPALRNLLQRCPADKLRSSCDTGVPALNGKAKPVQGPRCPYSVIKLWLPIARAGIVPDLLDLRAEIRYGGFLPSAFQLHSINSSSPYYVIRPFYV